MKQQIKQSLDRIKVQYSQLKRHYPMGIWAAWLILIWLLFKGISALFGEGSAQTYLNGALPVKVAQVVQKPMPIIRMAPGTLSALDSVSLTPQVSGKIGYIAVQQGDEVKAGDLILSIEKAPFEERKRAAEAAVREAEATLLQAELDAKRYANLAEKDYVSKQQAEQAQTYYEGQKAHLITQQALLEQANIELGYTEIRSPLSGKLGDFNLNPGDFLKAEAETPMMTINQPQVLWLNFSLNQSDFAYVWSLQKHAPLSVRIFSEQNKQAELARGTVAFIDNTIQSNSGTFGLKAKIDNPEQALWPGMSVLTELTLKVEPDTLVIPGEAIQFDQAGHFVYVVESGKAVVKRVRVNRRLGDEAVIESGLLPSEQVILSISPDLSNGRVVKVDAPI